MGAARAVMGGYEHLWAAMSSKTFLALASVLSSLTVQRFGTPPLREGVVAERYS